MSVTKYEIFFQGKFQDNDFKNEIKNPSKKSLLNLNLSEIGGKLFTELNNGLRLSSPSNPNRTILETLLKSHQYVFRDLIMIQEIMRIPDESRRTSQAFIKLGIHDVRCTVEWLFKKLFIINELSVMKNILENGPIWLELLTRPNMVLGEEIRFQVKAIQEYNYEWICTGDMDDKAIKNVTETFTCQVISYVPKREGQYKLRIYKSRRTNESFFESPPINVGDISSCYTPLVESKSDSSHIALLVGFTEYQTSEKLHAPIGDIYQLGNTLNEIGYNVYSFLNLKTCDFNRVLKAFTNKITAKESHVIFYYAGHGKSKNNADYVTLLEEDMNVLDILKIISAGEPKIALTIFDMCRVSDNSKDQCKVEIPNLKNIIYLPTTLPYEKAYEFKENDSVITSKILKPLIECFENHSCSLGVNDFLMEFSKKLVVQKTQLVISGENNGICLGIHDKKYPSIIKKLQMDGKILDSSICIKVLFSNQFYNKLIISSESNEISFSNKATSKETIDLFEYFRKSTGSAIVTHDIFIQENKHCLEIYLPDEIAEFYK